MRCGGWWLAGFWLVAGPFGRGLADIVAPPACADGLAADLAGAQECFDFVGQLLALQPHGFAEFSGQLRSCLQGFDDGGLGCHFLALEKRPSRSWGQLREDAP